MRRLMFLTSALAMLLANLACQRSAPTKPSAEAEKSAVVEVAVFAINDFHGNLEAANFSSLGFVDTPVLAGGTAHLASMLQALRAQHQHHVFVGVGDLIGASPLLSSMLEDRPAHAALAALGMKYSAVGNHEFDYSVAALMAMQNGGCAIANCAADQRFEAAKFQYLASNVVDTNKKELFPGSAIETFDGIQLGLVAATLQDTPAITLAKNVAGAEFLEETQSINQQVAKLKAAGVRSIVAMIHQGGDSKTPLNGDASCDSLTGEIVPILAKLDPEIDVVLTAHTHKLYVCRYGKMLVTQAASYGRVLTEVSLKIDRQTGEVLQSSAINRLVDANKLAADPAQLAIIADAKSKTDAVTQKIVSYLSTATISKKPDASGESDLSRLIADAQWYASKDAGNADLALINDGGVRTDLPNVMREKTAQGYPVTVGDIYGVQPFGNEIYVLQLTGSELLQVLEAQIDGEDRLTGSSALRYQIDRTQAKGARIQQVTIAGKPLRLDANYRVAINNYLASGGSKQSSLISKKALYNAGFDRDALTAYLQTQPAAANYQQIRSAWK